MKRTFVSHCIFPRLGTVFLPSRKTRVELELCRGWGGGRAGQGLRLGPGIPFREGGRSLCTRLN